MILYDPAPATLGPIRDIPPCKDCPDRVPACHASCHRYADWREKLEAVKANRLKYDKLRDLDTRKGRTMY